MVSYPQVYQKEQSFSTQEKHVVLLGLEALSEAFNLCYATRSSSTVFPGSLELSFI